MPTPVWPIGISYEPERDSWSQRPFLAPLASEMDGGNVRLRSKPGDRVRIIQQSIVVPNDAYADTLEPFLIENRAARVIMPVWLGKEFKTCMVQLTEIQTGAVGIGSTRVSMSVRVIRENVSA